MQYSKHLRGTATYQKLPRNIESYLLLVSKLSKKRGLVATSRKSILRVSMVSIVQRVWIYPTIVSVLITLLLFFIIFILWYFRTQLMIMFTHWF